MTEIIKITVIYGIDGGKFEVIEKEQTLVVPIVIEEQYLPVVTLVVKEEETKALTINIMDEEP